MYIYAYYVSISIYMYIYAHIYTNEYAHNIHTHTNSNAVQVYIHIYVYMHKHSCIVKFWHNTHTRAHILFYIPSHRHSIHVYTHVHMYTADRDSARRTSLDVSETRCASHTTIPVTFSAGTRSVNKSTTMMRDVIAITPPMIVTQVMCQTIERTICVHTKAHMIGACNGKR